MRLIRRRIPLRWRRHRAFRSRVKIMIFLIFMTCILLTPLYVIYRTPHFLIRWLQNRCPDVLWHVPTTERIVALTIDDGPSPYTEEIRRLLADNDATATLFVIGSQIDGREEVLRDFVRSGNELGNHAMHDEVSFRLSDATLRSQMRAVEGRLREVYSVAREEGKDGPPAYFRPGSGFYNSRMRDTMREMGYRLVLGGIYPHDAQLSAWWWNAWFVLGRVRPCGIIICHDRRSWTVPMLRKVLPELKQRGYKVVTVSALLEHARTLGNQ